MKSYLTNTENVRAMARALIKTKQFTVERTTETIKATHTATGKLALQGLKKGSANAWIMREHPNLWAVANEVDK